MNSFHRLTRPKSELLVSATVFLMLIASTPQAVRGQHVPRGQSRFGAEITIKNPVEIPSDVLSILRGVKRNQTCLGESESADSITKSWFVGSEIHLNGRRLVDLVVTARNECLLGANIVPFWVFRNTSRGHKLVLSVSALSLDVLNTRRNSYRDIRTRVATASSTYSIIFRFDGKEYRPLNRRN